MLEDCLSGKFTEKILWVSVQRWPTIFWLQQTGFRLFSEFVLRLGGKMRRGLRTTLLL